MAIVIDQKMPECCDKCWALDDYGDYPHCLISHTSKGYTFNIREKRMDNCPMNEFERAEIDKIINAYHDALQIALTDLMNERRPDAEWIETGITIYKEKCSRCGKIISGTYSDPSFDCPKYCPECGARMKNPHYHFVEIDYGD